MYIQNFSFLGQAVYAVLSVFRSICQPGKLSFDDSYSIKTRLPQLDDI